MQIFDAHTHINAPQFKDDIPDVITRAHALDVTAMLVLADSPASNARLRELLALDDHIYGALGCHPETALDYGPEWEELLLTTMQNPRYKAVGEIGLDYYHDVPHDVQKRIFIRQLELAQELHRPVVIHTRDALADTYDIMQAIQPQDGVIMHSFNGDAHWAEKFLACGYYLSFSGVVTFANAPEVREAALITPADRLLVETDAPYLAPIPMRGAMNEPGFTRYTLEFLAKIRGTTATTLAAQTFANTKRILKINEWKDKN